MIEIFKKKTFIFIVLITTFVYSKDLGDLTKQLPIEMSVNLKGQKGQMHFFEPNTLYFKTGKLYKLRIINDSDSKHYFSSSNFAKSIFTRKIQINKNNEKISEIKGNIFEVEVFPQNVIEWWFVPIKTGKFDDLQCSVIDEISKKRHFKMGMTGTIVIN
jgi:uncharacterized cupredoxin-like copper-binding protein